MNKIIIIAVALLIINTYTKAQSTEVNNGANNQINKTTTQAPFKVTKGYYSIYNNAEKLNHQPAIIVTTKKATINYTKGFYAISGKHTHLHKGGKSIIVKAPKRPSATKGYYSIKPAEVKTSEAEANLMANAVDSVHVVRDEN